MVNISFYLSAYFPLAEIFILYFTLPQPHNFLMVHLTLRAEPPCLVHQVIKRAMNDSAAGRVHGPSLSFIQWRIQGRDPEGLDQTKARRVEKNFLETCPSPPPPLSKGLDDRPSPSLISRSGSGSVIYHPNSYNTSPMLNSHDSFYWQMFHEPLTLNIFNEKHSFATYARTKEHFMSLLIPCK